MHVVGESINFWQLSMEISILFIPISKVLEFLVEWKAQKRKVAAQCLAVNIFVESSVDLNLKLFMYMYQISKFKPIVLRG